MAIRKTIKCCCCVLESQRIINKKKVNGARIICIFEAGFIFGKVFKVMLVKKNAFESDTSVLKSPTNSFFLKIAIKLAMKIKSLGVANAIMEK